MVLGTGFCPNSYEILANADGTRLVLALTVNTLPLLTKTDNAGVPVAAAFAPNSYEIFANPDGTRLILALTMDTLEVFAPTKNPNAADRVLAFYCRLIIAVGCSAQRLSAAPRSHREKCNHQNERVYASLHDQPL
jgi:hypothetical protein